MSIVFRSLSYSPPVFPGIGHVGFSSEFEKELFHRRDLLALNQVRLEELFEYCENALQNSPFLESRKAFVKQLRPYIHRLKQDDSSASSFFMYEQFQPESIYYWCLRIFDETHKVRDPLFRMIDSWVDDRMICSSDAEKLVILAEDAIGLYAPSASSESGASKEKPDDWRIAKFKKGLENAIKSGAPIQHHQIALFVHLFSCLRKMPDINEKAVFLKFLQTFVKRLDVQNQLIHEADTNCLKNSLRSEGSSYSVQGLDRSPTPATKWDDDSFISSFEEDSDSEDEIDYKILLPHPFRLPKRVSKAEMDAILKWVHKIYEEITCPPMHQFADKMDQLQQQIGLSEIQMGPFNKLFQTENQEHRSIAVNRNAFKMRLDALTANVEKNSTCPFMLANLDTVYYCCLRSFDEIFGVREERFNKIDLLFESGQVSGSAAMHILALLDKVDYQEKNFFLENRKIFEQHVSSYIEKLQKKPEDLDTIYYWCLRSFDEIWGQQELRFSWVDSCYDCGQLSVGDALEILHLLDKMHPSIIGASSLEGEEFDSLLKKSGDSPEISSLAVSLVNLLGSLEIPEKKIPEIALFVEASRFIEKMHYTYQREACFGFLRGVVQLWNRNFTMKQQQWKRLNQSGDQGESEIWMDPISMMEAYRYWCFRLFDKIMNSRDPLASWIDSKVDDETLTLGVANEIFDLAERVQVEKLNEFQFVQRLLGIQDRRRFPLDVKAFLGWFHAFLAPTIAVDCLNRN